MLGYLHGYRVVVELVTRRQGAGGSAGLALSLFCACAADPG